MTRKVRKSKLRKSKIKNTSRKIHTKRKRKHRNIKGGMFGMAAKMASQAAQKYAPQGEQTQDEPKKRTRIETLGRLLKFSLGSLIISPLYIMAVIANIPLNTLNNLSGKSFNDNKADALGIQLYKYMFEGYKKVAPEGEAKESISLEEKYKRNKEAFIVDEGLTIKGQLVTRCDSEKCNAKRGGYMKGGYMNTYKTFGEMLGTLTTNEKVIHNLKSLEDTIDSIKNDFTGRKDEIKKMFKNLKDPDVLFKMIVVCNNLIGKCEESLNPDEKAHLIEDNVVVKNPYQLINKKQDFLGTITSYMNMEVCYLDSECMKSCNKCDLFTNISCAIGMKLGPECDKCNCNLFNNIITVYSAYVRILLKSFAGNSNNIYFISELLFMITRFYANSVDLDIGKNKYIINLNLDKIDEIKYIGNFNKVTKDNMEAIELFKKVICKYGIYEVVKKNFKEIVDKAKKDDEELYNLKKKLFSICDAPDDLKENLKTGLKTMKKGMKNVLSGKIPFKKETEPVTT